MLWRWVEAVRLSEGSEEVRPGEERGGGVGLARASTWRRELGAAHTGRSTKDVTGCRRGGRRCTEAARCMSSPHTQTHATPTEDLHSPSAAHPQASALTKSCNCNSSVATRVGFSLIFLLNSLLAWVMLSDWAIKLIAKWSYDYIKMECAEGRCYGVLAVSRVPVRLVGGPAADRRTAGPPDMLRLGPLSWHTQPVPHQRARHALEARRDPERVRPPTGLPASHALTLNDFSWWGPKVALWLALVFTSFAIPNGFFMFYGSTITLLGSTLFILIGLVLLIDFAHSWSETCLSNWEETDSPLWKYTLIGSTLSLFVLQLVLVGLQYAFFAGSGCGLNQFFISFNLALSIAVTVLSVSPAVQEANPRSGLAQSGMVVAYTAYLVMSAIANHDDGEDGEGRCNPLQKRADGAKTGMVVLGAVFTFLAIACECSHVACLSLRFHLNFETSLTSTPA